MSVHRPHDGDEENPARRPRRLRADDGQASLEFVGFLPLLLLIGLAAVQLGLVAYAAQQAGTAARAAARAESLGEESIGGEQAGRAAISEWLADRTTFGLSASGEEVTATATVAIPSVIPGIDGLGEVSRESTMPRDRDD
ncbi:MAG TPA: TadE/TadG family type IV pilus assembly protein [Streptomyces sp.]|uniref:TadE/TadG family type IV pilus assembly protein n=1 Tax=Streptomyces sp. TaxID=1931 RepID=UPI002D61E5E0|nr:TadE/TadG family type IV pilus assembly protein [Streptomyces sp.]HZG03374.1 TadE/TadG family type IV pilus assembly protein [Streptomyces sp.]